MEVTMILVHGLAALGFLTFSGFAAVITVKTVWNKQRNYILNNGVTLGKFHQWWFNLPRINR